LQTPRYITRANTSKISGEKSEHRAIFQDIEGREFFELHEFAGYGSFIRELDKFMMEYNTIRLHQSLGYMTPSKFYEEILRNNASRGVLVV